MGSYRTGLLCASHVQCMSRDSEYIWSHRLRAHQAPPPPMSWREASPLCSAPARGALWLHSRTYMHVGTDADWATIECGLRKKANGNCIAAPHCIYKGCVEVTEDYYARMAAKRSMGVAPSEAGSDE